MTMPKSPNFTGDFDIFVGGKTGAFKGIKVDKEVILVKNLQNVEILKPENEISALSWSDSTESEILIGTSNQVVRIYDTEFKAYSSSMETKIGTGPIVGLTRVNGAVTTCSQSGHIKTWTYRKSEGSEFSAEGHVSHMRKCDQKEGIIGTGGQKNDLKVWDLETKAKIFCAKNVKKDMLELEVPVWVSDLTFLRDCEYKIAVATRYGQIRLYDTKAQRRPVVNISLGATDLNRTMTCISLCSNENQVVVGCGTGYIMLADLRGKAKIVNSYKGAVGSIRQVTAHPTLPYVASVGLDRYLRVHHLETKKLLHQQYLKVRLNCLLMRSTFGTDVQESEESAKGDEEEKIELVDLGSDEEYENIFNDMETVGGEEEDGPVRKKQKKMKKN